MNKVHCYVCNGLNEPDATECVYCGVRIIDSGILTEPVRCFQCKHHVVSYDPAGGKPDHICRLLGIYVDSEFYCKRGKNK